MADRLTEQLHPLGAGLHKKTAAEVLGAVLTGQQRAMDRLHDHIGELIPIAEAAAKALAAGSKLAYAGAGSSGLMALADCLELAGTFGIPREQTPMMFAGGAAALVSMTGSVEDDDGQAVADVKKADISEGDVVLCLAASGSTPYTLAVARAARELGATVVGLANSADAPLFQLCDLTAFLDSGPEIVAGSTRLGAATTQKAALNMISVLIGVRLGAVHDGLMVNPAILVARGMTFDEARHALIASKGRLAPYLD